MMDPTYLRKIVESLILFILNVYTSYTIKFDMFVDMFNRNECL
jgi:hypothetical protein